MESHKSSASLQVHKGSVGMAVIDNYYAENVDVRGRTLGGQVEIDGAVGATRVVIE